MGPKDTFPQPESTPLIVLDHFHVNKYLNDALDAVRKEELKKARQENDGELSRILHCNKRFILMQNKVTHKKRDILDRLARLNERVYQGMLVKELSPSMGQGLGKLPGSI